MALCVAKVAASDAFLYVISSTRLPHSQQGYGQEENTRVSRLQSDNIADELAFVPAVIAHLAGPVQ